MLLVPPITRLLQIAGVRFLGMKHPGSSSDHVDPLYKLFFYVGGRTDDLPVGEINTS
jgi:hypothetical protein